MSEYHYGKNITFPASFAIFIVHRRAPPSQAHTRSITGPAKAPHLSFLSRTPSTSEPRLPKPQQITAPHPPRTRNAWSLLPGTRVAAVNWLR